jgi:DNA-binding NarL/FixJ family response regulator
MAPLSIVLIDDHPIFRRGLRRVLEQSPDLQVGAEASDGYSVLQQIWHVAPDVAICGINVPGTGGLEAARLLRQRYPHCRIIVLTAHEDDDVLFNAFLAGADACATKAIAIDELVTMVRQVGHGVDVINDQVLQQPLVAARLLAELRQRRTVAMNEGALVARLTPRETEILAYVAQGLTNKQIGQELAISSQTVKNHMTSIMHKLAVHRRTQAVLSARHYGWVTRAAPLPSHLPGQEGQSSHGSSQLG